MNTYISDWIFKTIYIISLKFAGWGCNRGGAKIILKMIFA